MFCRPSPRVRLQARCLNADRPVWFQCRDSDRSRADSALGRRSLRGRAWGTQLHQLTWRSPRSRGRGATVLALRRRSCEKSPNYRLSFCVSSLACHQLPIGREVFFYAWACKLGAEGIRVQNGVGALPAGPIADWLKVKNPAAPTVNRETQDWRH
jgi:hypothetical protein